MRRLLLAILMASAVTGCYNGAQKPGPTDGASLDFGAKATIAIRDNGIEPNITQGRVGDAITVTNRGTTDHGLTSKTIETGILRPGESTTLFLTDEGTIDVHDRADPSHTARVEVAPAPDS